MLGALEVVDRAEELRHGLGDLVDPAEIVAPVAAALARADPHEPVAIGALDHERCRIIRLIVCHRTNPNPLAGEGNKDAVGSGAGREAMSNGWTQPSALEARQSRWGRRG